MTQFLCFRYMNTIHFWPISVQVDAETHRRITFHEIRCKCAALARWFHAENIGKGHTVGLMSSNNDDFIWILLGVWSSGAACHLISRKSTLRKLYPFTFVWKIKTFLMLRYIYNQLRWSAPWPLRSRTIGSLRSARPLRLKEAASEIVEIGLSRLMSR